MYPPPQIIESEVFARVPDTLRRAAPSWMSRHHGRAVDCFLEGPGFDRAGNLYVTDLAHGRIFRISPAGDFSVAAEYDGRPNGLRIRGDGAIFVTDRKNGIVRLHPDNGRIETILPELPTG
ncbi:MAG TPA: SMP-30/gluconolactonase/LRE family protein, partial [Acetobacteraceae bacterium]